MILANEGNTSLAFDTVVLRDCGAKYGQIAKDLRDMATKLDDCIAELKDSGWTTPAGDAFHKMTKTNWNENIEKYADLLDTLEEILKQSAKKYEALESNYIEKTTI